MRRSQKIAKERITIFLDSPTRLKCSLCLGRQNTDSLQRIYQHFSRAWIECSIHPLVASVTLREFISLWVSNFLGPINPAKWPFNAAFSRHNLAKPKESSRRTTSCAPQAAQRRPHWPHWAQVSRTVPAPKAWAKGARSASRL